jgi:hypothetical protein
MPSLHLKVCVACGVQEAASGTRRDTEQNVCQFAGLPDKPACLRGILEIGNTKGVFTTLYCHLPYEWGQLSLIVTLH